jgi:hypothetical protein
MIWGLKYMHAQRYSWQAFFWCYQSFRDLDFGENMMISKECIGVTSVGWLLDTHWDRKYLALWFYISQVNTALWQDLHVPSVINRGDNHHSSRLREPRCWRCWFYHPGRVVWVSSWADGMHVGNTFSQVTNTKTEIFGRLYTDGSDASLSVCLSVCLFVCLTYPVA